jgi:hypothetical protein
MKTRMCVCFANSRRRVVWTGAACSQQDISADFHLMFWTSFMLFVVLLFSISLMSGMGGGVEGGEVSVGHC